MNVPMLTFRGANPQESVNGFLRRVRGMDNFGTTWYDVKYQEKSCRVAASPRGIGLYHSNRQIELFDWLDVAEVSFKGKKVSVIVKEKVPHVVFCYLPTKVYLNSKKCMNLIISYIYRIVGNFHRCKLSSKHHQML